jgi:hypothetical protein
LIDRSIALILRFSASSTVAREPYCTVERPSCFCFILVVVYQIIISGNGGAVVVQWCGGNIYYRQYIRCGRKVKGKRNDRKRKT